MCASLALRSTLWPLTSNHCSRQPFHACSVRSDRAMAIVLRWLYTRSVLTNDLHLVPEIEYELSLVCLSTTLGRCLKRIRWRIQSKRRRHVNNSRYTAINLVEIATLVLSTVTVDSYFLQGNSQQRLRLQSMCWDATNTILQYHPNTRNNNCEVSNPLSVSGIRAISYEVSR